jgi:hypothetical protein
MYPQWFEGSYSPYCAICECCGEDGCCSALACQQHPHGEYCTWYMKDFHFHYRMLRKLEILLEKQGFDFESPEYKEIYDEAYEQAYGK